MMKHLIFLLLLSASVHALASQDMKNFFQANDNIKSWFMKGYDSELKNAISTFQGNPEFELYFEYHYSDTDSSFHFIDYDQDGQKDLMFFGGTGAESERIIFFQKKDGKFTEQLSLWGEFLSANKPTGTNTLSFSIYNYACCAGTEDYIESYYVHTSCTGSSFKHIEEIMFHNVTPFPEELFEKPVAFETINNGYKLREAPIIDDTTEEYPEVYGNTVVRYPGGSRGTAYAKHIDETGREWWFVKMYCRKEHEDEGSSSANNTFQPHIMGWMSSRFVKVLY